MRVIDTARDRLGAALVGEKVWAMGADLADDWRDYKVIDKVAPPPTLLRSQLEVAAGRGLDLIAAAYCMSRMVRGVWIETDDELRARTLVAVSALGVLVDDMVRPDEDLRRACDRMVAEGAATGRFNALRFLTCSALAEVRCGFRRAARVFGWKGQPKPERKN